MDLVQLKILAQAFKPKDEQALSEQVLKLKQQGITLLGLIYFVQINQQSSLIEARKKTINFSFWQSDELLQIEENYQIMLSDFTDQE